MALAAQTIWSHLERELHRLDLHIRRSVLAARSANPSHGADEYRGLYVSDQDVEHMLSQRVVNGSTQQPPEGLEAAITVADKEIVRSRAAASEQPLVRLVSRLRLSPFEHDALLVCLAPEVDTRYERLYGYLHDDVTRRRPTLRLMMDLFCTTPEARLEARKAFTPGAPLFSWHILRQADDGGSRQLPLLARPLKLDDPIVEYLLGGREADARLEDAIHRFQPVAGSNSAAGIDEAKLSHLALLASNGPEGVLIIGRDRDQRRAAAQSLAGHWKQSLLVIDLGSLIRVNLAPQTIVTLVWRRACLENAVPYWDGVDLLLEDGHEAWLTALTSLLRSRPHLVLFGSRVPWEPLLDRSTLRLEVDDLTFAERRQLWAGLLDGDVPSEAAAEVAGRFRLGAGQIHAAVWTARGLARSHGRAATVSDLLAAAREHSNRNLARLARKVVARHTWDDIVLPPDRQRLLREVCQYVRLGHIIYGDWGFDRKFSLGKGLNALFAGQSGTGKTMAAEVIANDIGLDLYKINLATVVSKYIGETEKNLDGIFTEADGSNAILFFDEADAIFGKRSEVRDSHDRYANLEIAYLLQKMEEYDGVSILATNLRKNIDDAFVRRLHFAVEFPMPEEDERLRIWHKVFPAEAPLAPGVDLIFLARRFRISGGNIKNVAVAAAFLAAEEGVAIQMRHLIGATKREFQKMGRLVTQDDFGEYFPQMATGG